MFKPYFMRLANYNIWANGLLYDAADQVPKDQQTEDVGAFFGSLSGTLNHIIIADRIWLRRLRGDGPEETQHDRIVSHDMAKLRAARRVEDDRVMDFVGTRQESDYAGTISYRTTSGEPFSQQLDAVLAHFFNHQTHHRGQAHDILTRLTGSAPSIDLLYYIRSLDD
ncbi:MAG: DinB family protein [Minwuia sp.]|nr:DinB family protein [Minwuia sp.]